MKKNLNWFFGFFAFNSIITFVISLLYLSTPSTRPDNILVTLFTIPYFWSHMGLLSFILYLPFLFLLFFNQPLIKWVFCFYAAFLQTLLLIDTFVFQQYRFHINLFVLDLFFNGQGQVISFSWFLWGLVMAFLIALWILELWFSSKIFHFSKSKNLKLTAQVLGILFTCLILTHISHALADAHFYRPITKMGTIPPFAIPLNAQETLFKYGLVDVEAYKNKSLMTFQDEEKSLVHYPLDEINCGEPEKLNVLFILLDSVRSDALNEQVMPNAFELSQKSTVFLQHYSGSNSTRGGVFSFFYGLPPLYFDKFKDTHTSPVLIDQFLKNNYKLKILGSAPLTKPEFDRTIFSKVTNLRTKSKAFPAYERDREITNEWLDFTQNRKADEPFFGFLFYDSAHEFSNEPGNERFKPFLQDINYFTLNNSTDPTLFINRYHNSIYYIDEQLKRVFDDLKKNGLFNNTVVILSSDHGKEFNDNKLNYWGHNSNFTDAQTHVPLFIYWPNASTKKFPKTIDHWTSHYDIAPTLMEEFFHCKNSPTTYSSGENLMRGEGHQWLLHGTYGDFGIRLKDHFIVIKTSGSYEVLDLHYHPVDNIQVNYDIYNKALMEMRRFYK